MIVTITWMCYVKITVFQGTILFMVNNPVHKED